MMEVAIRVTRTFLPFVALVVAYTKYGDLSSPDSIAKVQLKPSQLLPKYDFIIVGGGSAGG